MTPSPSDRHISATFRAGIYRYTIILGFFPIYKVIQAIENHNGDIERKVSRLRQHHADSGCVASEDAGKRVAKNGGKLTIATARWDGSLEVSFTDTGVGIPEEKLSKLFEPLFTTRARGASSPSSCPSRREVAMSTSVLIVDDDIEMLETTADILETKGYAVTTTNSGRAAIALAECHRFDVALIDIVMPDMNGVEVLKAIKRLRPGMVVIMMTAYSVDELVREAMQEGALLVAQKPLDIAAITQLLERSGGGFTILVVDDDANMCTTLKDVLEESGYRVRTAGDGHEAVAIAHKEHLDMVFMDMKLPTINGLVTFLAIKDINPRVTAIIMTGYREETREQVEQALANCARACLYKPFDLARVVEMVSEASQLRKVRGVKHG